MDSEDEETVNFILGITGSEVLITKSIKEIMTGYSDPILFTVNLN